MGTETNYFGMDNVKRAALPMKSIDDALELRNDVLLRLEEGAGSEILPSVSGSVIKIKFCALALCCLNDDGMDVPAGHSGLMVTFLTTSFLTPGVSSICTCTITSRLVYSQLDSLVF